MIEVQVVGGSEYLKALYFQYKKFLETHPKNECPKSCIEGYERREIFVKKYKKLFDKQLTLCYNKYRKRGKKDEVKRQKETE